MKHLDSQIALLSALCRESSIELSVSALEAMVRYLDAVLLANQSINLTRITDPTAALRLHVLDSLSSLPEVDSAPDGRLCDIGSGAGFPGVPIALATARSCTLLDSVRKKGDVAARILTDMGMGDVIQVSHDRAEQHARVHAGEYAVVTARAVAPLASLVELAAPLLRQGGVLVALKGDPADLEVASGLTAAHTVGLTQRSRRDFVLAGGTETRSVITYEKTGRSRIDLPRREGLAQHSPLG